jgi:hypothetical protein
MPENKKPDPKKNETVTAQRQTTYRVSTRRVPALDESGATQFITEDETRLEYYQKQPNYPKPDISAHNWVTQMPEGKKMIAIQQQLYAAGFYKSQDVLLNGQRDQATINALQNAMEAANVRGVKWETIANQSIALNNSFGINSATTAGDGSGGTSGTATAGQLNITGPKQARSILNSMYLKYTGKVADDKTFSRFYDALTDAQSKSPTRYEQKTIAGKTYSVQVSDGVGAEDFAERYVSNRIDFGSEELSGLASDNLTAIERLADMYNVSLSSAEIAKYNKGLTRGIQTENDIRKVLANKAKIKFPALTDSIDETVTTKDLLSEHINIYAQTLEIPANQVKMSDVVKSAFKEGKLVNVYDMQDNIKNTDIRYGTTKQARSDAAGFAIGLARTLGYGI